MERLALLEIIRLRETCSIEKVLKVFSLTDKKANVCFVRNPLSTCQLLTLQMHRRYAPGGGFNLAKLANLPIKELCHNYRKSGALENMQSLFSVIVRELR